MRTNYEFSSFLDLIVVVDDMLLCHFMMQSYSDVIIITDILTRYEFMKSR